MTASLRVGLRGLHTRGLVTLSPPDGEGEGTHAYWAHPAAAAIAARRSVIPFNLSLRTQAMLGHAADVLEGSRRHFTATALALVLAHRYQFTGVHALTITTTVATVSKGSGDRSGDRTGFEVVEHRHQHPGHTRLLSAAALDPARLRRGGAGLDTDERRILLPADLEAMALHAFYACHQEALTPSAVAASPDGRNAAATLRINLDRMAAGGLDEPWMPALLADAVSHLGISEGDLPTPEAFAAWAHERLRYPLRCGQFTHVRHIHPSTGTVHTPPEYAEQYAAEEMLTALQAEPGESTGCAAAEEFLLTPLGSAIWSGVPDEIVLRWVVRAVQYLDAGLDLREAADFLLFAIPAEQAARLVDRRRAEPGEVNELLRRWTRSLLNRGTIT